MSHTDRAFVEDDVARAGDVAAAKPAATPGEAPVADAGEPKDPSPGVSRDDVLGALSNVIDPELGVDIVNLGLVYGVEITGNAVHITYTLTTMGCPIGPMIEAQMKTLIAELGADLEVEAEMVLRPPWTPEMMTEEAKAALGYF